jgi:hypothetical protein
MVSRFARTLSGTAVTLAFFCGGSLPELLGTSLAIRPNGDPSPLTIEAHLFDLFAHEWSWTHPLTTSLITKFTPSVRASVEAQRFDLLAPDAGLLGPVARAGVIMFAHCLNEFAGNERAIDAIEAIVGLCSPGTIVAFLDKERYRVTTGALRALKQRLLGQGFEMIEDCDAPYAYTPPDFFLPDAVNRLFFDGKAELDERGNWKPGHFRARTLNLRALVVRKRE